MQSKKSGILTGVAWACVFVVGSALVCLALEFLTPVFMPEPAHATVTPRPEPLSTLPFMTAVPYSLPSNKACTDEKYMEVGKPFQDTDSRLDITAQIDTIIKGAGNGPYAILDDGRALRIGDGVPDRQGEMVGMVTTIETRRMYFCQIKNK